MLAAAWSGGEQPEDSFLAVTLDFASRAIYLQVGSSAQCIEAAGQAGRELDVPTFSF